MNDAKQLLMQEIVVRRFSKSGLGAYVASKRSERNLPSERVSLPSE